MRQLGNLKRKSFYDRFIGQTLDVLVESRRDETTGLLKGFSSNYVPVMFEGGDELKNTIVKIGFADIGSVEI